MTQRCSPSAATMQPEATPMHFDSWGAHDDRD
jgi:hypothetical protein